MDGNIGSVGRSKENHVLCFLLTKLRLFPHQTPTPFIPSLFLSFLLVEDGELHPPSNPPKITPPKKSDPPKIPKTIWIPLRHKRSLTNWRKRRKLRHEEMTTRGAIEESDFFGVLQKASKGSGGGVFSRKKGE